MTDDTIPFDDFPLWSTQPHPERGGMWLGRAVQRGGRELFLTSENREFLQQELLRMQLCYADDGDDRFLAAWKRGVQFAPALFHCATPTVEAATDKNQLRPSWDAVEAFLRSRPEPWKRDLIMSLCSFYNNDWMEEWAKKLRIRRSIGTLAITLDGDHREVLADLLDSYRGW